MANSTKANSTKANSTNSFDRRTNHLLRSIQLCGGCVPLHRLQFQFSDSVIQTLLDKQLVRVQNTGHSFLLQISAQIVQSRADTNSISSEKEVMK